MSRATFNKFSLEIPDGWDDSSIVTLLAPVPPVQRTMTAAQGQVERPSLAVRRVAVSQPNLDIDAFAELQAELMTEIASDAKVVDKGELTIDTVGEPLRAVTREYTFTAGKSLVRQIHVYIQAAKEFYAVVGTGLMDNEFPKLREQFVGLVKSMRFAG